MKTKIPAGFVPRTTIKTINGEIAVDGLKYKVTFMRGGGKVIVNYFYDFSDHPLGQYLENYILNEPKEVAASTINQRCRAVKLLGEFLKLTDESELTPEVFKAFCHWMLEVKKLDGNRRFADSVIPSYVNNIRALYKSGLEHNHPRWSQQDLDLISNINNKVLRGCRERSVQDSVEKALSLNTFASLIKAIGFELKQCRDVLAARKNGERKSLYNLDARHMAIIDPNPFVVLSLIGVTHHGLRAEGHNALTNNDLRVDIQFGHHELYIHAPNKKDDFIPVNDTFVEAWQLCEEWSNEARALAGPDGKDMFQDSLFVYPPTNSYHSHPLMRLSTYYLNTSHLPYFFKKWFAHKIIDDEGHSRPLLHAEGDSSRPLKVSYKKLRNAFAVRFAERNKSRAAMARAMGHSSPHTSEKFYLQQTRLDHARKVHIALKLEAHSLAMCLKNSVAAGVTEETIRRAREAGAMTPQGICGSALEGSGCERASDCLECPFLVVVASRKSRFVADRDAYLELAEKLERKGDVRGAENALSRAKMCQAHLIRIEGTFGGVNDEHAGK